ncbi:hypothetical protein MTO96_022478 [Rhipicephalus appendiculatus]
MPKSPLLFVQILSWFCAVVSTANSTIHPGFFSLPQRGNDTAGPLLDNAYPAGVTSSLDSLQKAQPGFDLFRRHGSWLTDSMPYSPLLFVQILPWFCAVVSTANSTIHPGFFEVPQRGNDTADRLLENAYPAGVRSSLDSLQKAQPGFDLFRGRGSWLTDSVPKSPLLFVKILPWFCAVVSTANSTIHPGFFALPQRGNDTAYRLLHNAYPAGVTSSLDSLQKAQPGSDLFRGHGSWLTDSMPKSPLLFVQILPLVLRRCFDSKQHDPPRILRIA